MPLRHLRAERLGRALARDDLSRLRCRLPSRAECNSRRAEPIGPASNSLRLARRTCYRPGQPQIGVRPMDITISHEGFSFGAPTDLRVSATNLRRVLLVGSCQVAWFEALIPTLPEGCPVDFMASHNYAQLPPEPPKPAEDYDFQICQIPVRGPNTRWCLHSFVCGKRGFGEEPVRRNMCPTRSSPGLCLRIQ